MDLRPRALIIPGKSVNAEAALTPPGNSETSESALVQSVIKRLHSDLDSLSQYDWLSQNRTPTSAEWTSVFHDLQRSFQWATNAMFDFRAQAPRRSNATTPNLQGSWQFPEEPAAGGMRANSPSPHIQSPRPEIPSPRVSHTVHVSTDDAGYEWVNNLVILRPIGSGSCAQVALCHDNETDEMRALKIIDRDKLLKINPEHIVQEVAIMKKLRHPNIVRLYECIDDPEAEMVYLVMQYVDNGPLLKFDEEMHCTPFPITAVQKIVKQLVSAVGYMHAQGVVHCDIKPDNVLVDTKGNVYLADFGVSELIDKTKNGVLRKHGSPIFLAPEVLSTGHCTAASDMWALGVTIYAMVFGRLPFSGDTAHSIVQSILNDPLTFPPANPAQIKWTWLLRRLLERGPSKRMTACELRHDAILRGQALDEEPCVTTPGHLSPTREELESAVRVVAAQPSGAHRRPSLAEDLCMRRISGQRSSSVSDAANPNRRKSIVTLRKQSMALPTQCIPQDASVAIIPCVGKVHQSSEDIV